MTRRHTQALTLVGSNANNGLNTGPLNLNVNNAHALHSYVGWLRHCNGWNLTNKLRSVYGSTK